MVPQSSSSRREDRLAARISKSPPLGLAGSAVATLVMVLALAGVLPRSMFFIGAIALVAVAYKLDRRFKVEAPNAPPPPPAGLVPPPPPAPSTTSAPPASDLDLSQPPPPSVSPSVAGVGDLQAEHARLTRELTERVDADEDVRFEKFMRLRAIEHELAQQPPPS